MCISGTAAIRSLGLTKERRTRPAPAPLPAPRPAALRTDALTCPRIRCNFVVPTPAVSPSSFGHEKREIVAETAKPPKYPVSSIRSLIWGQKQQKRAPDTRVSSIQYPEFKNQPNIIIITVRGTYFVHFIYYYVQILAKSFN